VLTAIQMQSEAESSQNSVRGQYTGGRIGDVEIEDFLKTDDISPAR
jgi:glucose-6-phosphate 1-dehydrogenase